MEYKLANWGTPTLAVVIATYNRPKTLFRLLDTLNGQVRLDPRTISVCVVDDGSDIPLTGLFPAFKFQFQYYYRARSDDDLPKVYSSRNLGAQMAEGDYVLQLDDDVIFHERTLSELQNMATLFRAFKPRSRWVWIPRLSNNRDKCTDDNAGYDYGPDGLWVDGKARWRVADWHGAHSCGMFMPRKTWELVGGYDEDFDGSMGYADQEFAFRIYQRNGIIYHAPFFMHVADEETDSWRERMIAKARRDNIVVWQQKHPGVEV